jgi:tRNA A-37 threonylcarbamoyl transferase component Bud32
MDEWMPAAEEVPLLGGRLTSGIVRVGDTVRRPSKSSSPFMARLLEHLRDRGCSCVPRYLGQDDLGRDILTYIPGSTTKWARFRDEQVRAAAFILREIHEMTRESDLAPGAVVCHNDPGPNNFVFSNEMPVAVIDFDMAEPGDPLEDLGYMAWAWCVSSKPERGPVAEQAQQIRTLVDAYGLNSADRERLPDSILERQLRNIRFWSDRLAEPGSTRASPAKILEVIEWSKREAQYTEEHRRAFVAALT